MNLRTNTISFFCGFLCFHLSCFGQTNWPPKNFLGLLAGIEWNSLSGTWGMEYERVIFHRSQLAIGVKGNYFAPYKVGNMEILSGSSCCETAFHVLALGSASYYTGASRNLSGFFFHTGLGGAFGRRRYRSPSYHADRNLFRPAFEIGPGWLFKISESSALRCKATASFGSFTGAFTSTSVSFGF